MIVSGSLNAVGAISTPGTLRVSNNRGLIANSRYEMRGGTLVAHTLDLGGSSSNPGQFLMSGGDVTLQRLSFGSASVLRMSGGALHIRDHVYGAGPAIDLANAPVTLDLQGWGEFRVGAPVNARNAAIVVRGGGLLTFDAGYNAIGSFKSIDTDGLIHVWGQPLFVPPGKTLVGSVQIGAQLTNSGTVSPGNSPGSIGVSGNYVQASDASLRIELAGTAAGTFDALNITGTATLDGTLDLTLLDGFVPQPIDSFRFMTAVNVTGTFDNVIGGRIDFPGGRFNVTYSSTGVTLSNFQAVPEPAGIGLIALAGIAARRSQPPRRG